MVTAKRPQPPPIIAAVKLPTSAGTERAPPAAPVEVPRLEPAVAVEPTVRL